MKLGKTEGEPSKATFDEVYRKTYPSMFRIVMRRYANGDYDLARDYCQIGYIRVSSNFHKYSGKGNLEGWVRRVVTNTILTEMKRRKLETTSEYDFEKTEFEDIAYSEDWMGGTITTEDIMEAIGELPPTYKKVLILHYFEDKTLKEVGKVLGTHSGTQRSNLFKARKALRKKLGETIKRNIAI